jgi:hypothetical protein
MWVGRHPVHAPGADVPLPLARAPRHHQEQGDRDVGRVVGEHVGGVGDQHAVRARRRDVDVVVADAEVRHDPHAPPLDAEHVGGDPVGDRGEQRVGRPHRVGQLGLRERAVVGD